MLMPVIAVPGVVVAPMALWLLLPTYGEHPWTASRPCWWSLCQTVVATPSEAASWAGSSLASRTARARGGGRCATGWWRHRWQARRPLLRSRPPRTPRARACDHCGPASAAAPLAATRSPPRGVAHRPERLAPVAVPGVRDLADRARTSGVPNR